MDAITEYLALRRSHRSSDWDLLVAQWAKLSLSEKREAVRRAVADSH
jgi:hypothetical protein